MNDLALHLSKTFSINHNALSKAIESFMSQSRLPSSVKEPAVAYNSLQADIRLEFTGATQDEILAQIDAEQDSSKIISRLVESSGLTLKFIAEAILEITPKTLTRYKQESISLPKRIVEISIKLIELYKLGVEVFGGIEQFNEWCDRPAIGLNFSIPKDYFNTVTGIDCVKEELHRIMMGYPV